MRTSTSTWPDSLVLAAFLSSGVAALGLELIWVRVLGLVFGSESFGMLGVIAAFFAGLALGSAALHSLVVRSRRPVRIYIGAECVIAAYALAGPSFMYRMTEAMPRLLGPLVGDNRSLIALSVNLLIATVLLLPATVCMGATTVAIAEAWQRRRTAAQNASTIPWLYASNTFGATIGIALTTYWLLPVVGIQAASGILALFSLAAATLAWWWERDGPGSVGALPDRPRGKRAAPATRSTTLVYGLLFLTGLAGIGLETVGTQVFAQILENTVYTFANILGVYLLGTAFGAWLLTLESVRRFAGDRDRCTSLLLYALVAAGIAAAAILAHAPGMISALVPAGSSYAWRLTVQTTVIALVFLPATVCMGATYSHLVGYFTESGVGYALAFNTVGATLAPFVFGLVLIPSAGYGVAFYSALGVYVVLFMAAHLWNRQPVRWALAGAGFAAAAAALTYSPLILVRFAPNVEILEQRIGIFGVVSVAETSASSAPGVFRPRILVVDQNFQMGGSPGGVEKRMGHVSMLAANAPRNVLFLGVGTGITAGAALSYPVERVIAVDLVPEILSVLPWFGEFNARLPQDSRVVLRASDARRFIHASTEKYDAIVADLFHPSRDGTASLYTREHFLAIRSRLREGGVFVQWLPIYQMNPRDLKTIVRTFVDVFPEAHSTLASYSVRAGFSLVGWAPGPDGARGGIDVPRAEAVLGDVRGPRAVFEGLPDLLATYMLDAEGLRRYAGPGPMNTDNNQRITFDAAPAARRSEGDEFHGTLASLLPYRREFPDEFVREAGPDGLAALRQRVSPYARAATHYLAAEIIIRDAKSGTLPPGAVDEYVKAYEAEVGFTSATRRLLGLTLEYPGTAKDIVQRLWMTHPEQPRIARLREALDGVKDVEPVRRTVERFLQTGGN